MSRSPNYNVSQDIANALAGGGGMSESTVDAQHVKAIAVLTAATAVDSVESAAITKAIALLNASLAHIRDPKSHT